MRITKSGNWAMEWNYYHGSPATTYYRKGDVTKALRHYGHTGDERPGDAINAYSDAGFLVTQSVTPFRVVKH